jgi:hypothetical protein
MSTRFRPLIDLESNKLTHTYEVAFANGKVIRTDKVIPNCTITLENYQFSINLLPIELGGFDMVVRMDWLANNQAEIICARRLVKVPKLNGGSVVIRGERSVRTPELISCLRAAKCIKQRCLAIMAYVLETKGESRIEDVPVVSEFPDVFPDDL